MTTIEKTIRSVNIENEDNIKLISKRNADDVFISSNKDLGHYVVVNTMTINENCIDYVLLNIDVFDYLKDEYKNNKLLDLIKTSFYNNRFFVYKIWCDLDEVNDFLIYYDEYFTSDLKKDLLSLFKKVYDYIKSHKDDINYMK